MTKAESAFQREVRDLGCIVCLLHRKVFTPCEIHHRLSGGRRMGEIYVLGLCYSHHRSGRDDAECVSRDHNQRRFEAAYGTEQYLWDQTRIFLARNLVRVA